VRRNFNRIALSAGPGPFPAEDTYTQPPAGGFTGTRADANINSISFNTFGAAKQGTAETRVAAGSTGNGSASESIGTTVQITQFGGSAISFSFTGDPYLQVAVDKAGDTAVAHLETFIELSAAGGAVVFRWTPGMAAGEIGVATETDPFSLNTTLTANAPAGNTIFDPTADTFRATSILLPQGTYQLSLFQLETVQGTNLAAAVPAPATMLILSVGLGLGMAVSRRRRQA